MKDFRYEKVWFEGPIEQDPEEDIEKYIKALLDRPPEEDPVLQALERVRLKEKARQIVAKFTKGK